MALINRILVALLATAFCAAPANAAPEDMLTAIYDLDVDAVEDLVRDGEPVEQAYYRNVLEVAGVMSESEPGEVWWRRRLMDITGTLANQSEPDEATFEALRDALFPDAEGQAAMDLQGALSVYIHTEGRSGDAFERHLAQGADPLLRPARGDFPDMFGYLIHLAQLMTEEAGRLQRDSAELQQAVEHAWREMRSYADPPVAARYYLDAALTPIGEPIEFANDLDEASLYFRIRIENAQLQRIVGGVMSEVTDIGERNEDANTKSINWAREYAGALAE